MIQLWVFVAVLLMLVSAVKQVALPRSIFRARFHSRRFHIDDAGHGDWEGEREPRTIQVRFACVPESMIDALHGLRAIERQFGRIRDYRLLRVRLGRIVSSKSLYGNIGFGNFFRISGDLLGGVRVTQIAPSRTTPRHDTQGCPATSAGSSRGWSQFG